MLSVSKNSVLALFLPSETPFYLGLYKSLEKAFTQHGFRVVGGCTLLDNEELKSFVDEHNPKVFFEMNRCKSEINTFSKDILHICWLVDLAGRKLSDISGSDMVCFFSIEWMNDYKQKCIVEWLPPASDPDVYYPMELEKVFDTVFVGHIPKPWSKELNDRVVYKDILFEDVVKHFELKWAAQDSIVNNDRYIKEVIDWIDAKQEIAIDDQKLRYDIGCRIIRNSRRVYFLDWILNNENIQSMGIFGGDNWLLWQKYKKFYKSELKQPQDMNKVFNESKTVIHEGVGFHFRLFDAILASTPVIVRKSNQDYGFGGIGTILKEGEDYIAIDVDSDERVLKELLNDSQKLKSMASSAREKVLKKHTWFHRLQKIVSNINEY